MGGEGSDACGSRWRAYRALGTVVLQKVERVWVAPWYLMLMFVPVAAVLRRGVCIAGKREIKRRSA